MQLRSSPPSPFGRKIKIAMSILGLSDKIEVVDANTADPADALRSQNPLGKIPALILEDGEVLYDSAVILEYLDFKAGGDQLFPAGEARFKVLRDQALADGLMDAAILKVYEKRFKAPNYRDPAWDTYQGAKIDRALAYFEENTPAKPAVASDVDAATITLACALGYLDMRFAGAWRNDHPKLEAWLDAFAAAVPVFEKTKMPAAPVPDNDPAPLK